MPSPCAAPKIGDIDGSFPCYVVLVRDAFEVKVEKRLGHEGFPEFLSADSVKRSTPPVRGIAPHRSVEDRVVLVDVNHNRIKARGISLRIEKNAANEQVTLEKYQ